MLMWPRTIKEHILSQLLLKYLLTIPKYIIHIYVLLNVVKRIDVNSCNRNDKCISEASIYAYFCSAIKRN